MTRRMLLGLKRRAEALASSGYAQSTPADTLVLADRSPAAKKDAA
jgi:hypothetical protein